MSDDDWAIDYLLQTYYSSILHINSALAKAEINIVISSVDGLKHFNPSNAERFRLPANAAEVAELKHYQNFFKLLQLALILPAQVPLLCVVSERSQR